MRCVNVALDPSSTKTFASSHHWPTIVAYHVGTSRLDGPPRCAQPCRRLYFLLPACLTHWQQLVERSLREIPSGLKIENKIETSVNFVIT